VIDNANLWTRSFVDQAQMIQYKFEQYSQSTHDLTKFKREVLSVITVYDSLWRYFSKPSDKQDTDHDFCEVLLKKVASQDQKCARQLRQELDVKDRPMSMETMFNRLEDNQKLIESLDIDSPAKSKVGAVNSAEKRNSYTQIRLCNNNQGVQFADWNMT
jgi:hypothetical protein